MTASAELQERAWTAFKETWPGIEHSDPLELAVKQIAIQRAALYDMAKICTCDQPPAARPDGGFYAPGPHTGECVRTKDLAALAVQPYWGCPLGTL